MKKVAIYVRVSTARQDQEGYSIPLQKERLIAFCKAKGWVVSGIFIDPGHSGSSLDRPGISQLIDGVKAGGFDVVLVYKLDRLSRSQKDTLYLIEDVFMASGVDFVSMQESFDTATIYGRAMVGILSVFAQMERETIAERTLMGRAGRAEEGLWHGGGTSPIGYNYVDGVLVIDEEEARQVRRVYELFAAGYSVTEITRRMEGFKTKHGGWANTSTVGNVLDNPLYAGFVHFDGVVKKGQHAPIVDEKIDRKVKDRRARLALVESSGDSPYLLTGLLRCDACGARYFAHRRTNGAAVYSCHSRAKKNKKMIKDPSCKAPHIPLENLDAIITDELLRLAADPSLINKSIKKATISGGSGVAEDEILRLDAEIGRLMDLLQEDSLVSVSEIAGRIAAVHAKRTELLDSREPVKSKIFDVQAYKQVLRDVARGWCDLDLRGRRALLFQLFDRIHIGTDSLRIECAVEGLCFTVFCNNFSKKA